MDVISLDIEDYNKEVDNVGVIVLLRRS